MTTTQTSTPLLSVQNLEKTFSSGPPWRRRHVQAVRGVSFDIAPGSTFGLVGESGSGKSTTGRLIAQLISATGGDVHFRGEDVTTFGARQSKEWRREVGFIFQDPYGSLDSRMTVEQIISEPLLIHGVRDRKERAKVARELVDEVELPEAALAKYPHEFSGGQRQRIAIARALALRPSLIIADEPVSALDVSVQASVLNLFKDLQERHDLAYLFISHDLDVVEFMSDVIAVMYLGEIIESGPARRVFELPAHPYTKALFAAAPSIDAPVQPVSERIHGEIPSADAPPPGCSFHTRCPRMEEICKIERPPVVSDGVQESRCHFADPGGVGILPRGSQPVDGKGVRNA